MGKYDVEIEQEQRKITENQHLFDQCYDKYRQQIGQYLKEENYQEIIALYKQEDVLKLAQMDNEFAILNIIVNIYQMELNEHSTECIWNTRHSIKNMISVYLQLKMYLWRLEFTEDCVSFMQYAYDQKISVPCIKWLIHTSAFQKPDTIYKISALYKERGDFVRAFQMLYYLNECSDNKELVYCEMADIYMQLQQYELAAQCIEKIHDPTQLLGQYKRKWGITDG